MSDYVIITETPQPRTPAVYHTVPWLTQNATGGGYRTADGGAKTDRSCNTADGIQWKSVVSNITKYLEHVHTMKLKESSVFDCYNKASKFSNQANDKYCSTMATAPGFVSPTSSHGVCC